MQTDIVVIGSGIGGLSCGALLARYGFDVTVCESHAIPGGAAHSFTHDGFKFDSGPSLFSGLSYPSTNPLRHVLDAIGETVPCATYDAWGCRLPEGDFKSAIGSDDFSYVLRKLRGENAASQWRNLQAVMEPLGKIATGMPPAAMRLDFGAIFTIGKYLPNFMSYGLDALKLAKPFSEILQDVVTDEFVYNWMDMLCFLLAGVPAKGISAAEMAFMFAEWYRPGVVLDYPLGGSGAVIEALVRGLEKYDGRLMLNAHVKEVLVQQNRAVGVRLRNGKEIIAKEAVVSNASMWDTLDLFADGALPDRFRREKLETPQCDSFMHLHAGIDAAGLPEDLDCHYIVVKEWEITKPQNIVLVSIPSVLDPSLAPEGKHVIHAYTPGTEPYDLWEGLDRRSEEYQQQKRDRGEVLWKAIERVIPDLRERVEVSLVGTPLTHQRFLRRHRGTYGPAITAEQGLFPSGSTPIEGFWCCGDSTFPGIGVPAVAASGNIVANSIAPLEKHQAVLQELGF
ncbi:carotene isomerase [Leptolyngbya valderiana BDU 20041]|nr:carotene isomerase [Leptolyngbya valderiana BDU 20041]PPT10158.1 Phytoene dehydrogenase [Geitlerinema sp. FC II]